jgi:hypothetical protein
LRGRRRRRKKKALFDVKKCPVSPIESPILPSLSKIAPH